DVVREFDPDGTLLRTITYPSGELVHEVAIDDSGFIDSFGSSSPNMTRYSLTSNYFTHLAFPPWYASGQPNFVGLTAWQNFIYGAYLNTSAGGGIVRLNLSTDQVDPFATGTQFGDVSFGRDGKLYALTLASPNSISVFDPATLQLITQFPVPGEITDSDFVRHIAADSLGRIFLAGDYGAIYRLTSSGTLDASAATGWPGLTDIAIDETGRL